MTICTDCGKEFEPDDDWEDYGFVCIDCWEKMYGVEKEIEFEPDGDW